MDDGDFSFVGTPAQVVGQMQRFIDLGVDYFILDCAGFPDPTTLRLLIDEVLSALNALGKPRLRGGASVSGLWSPATPQPATTPLPCGSLRSPTVVGAFN